MSTQPSRLGVYFGQQVVGYIALSQQETYSFQYEPGWLNYQDRFPLSFALPLGAEPFGNKDTLAFFENLLPEEGAAQALEQSHRISSPFQFLQKFGKDCAGAVTVSAEPPKKQQKRQEKARIDPQLLQDALDQELSVAAAISHTVPGYLSVAGAQDKFAAIYENGDFYLPTDGSPTTHIIKPAIARKGVKESVFNELYVMKLAEAVGLSIPHCDIHYLGKHPLYVIQRYDRARDEQGLLYRLHQEDFCQARGLMAKNKYESAGGPSLLDHYNLIKRYSHPGNRADDLSIYLRWTAFNLLVGNNDCHAKNLSFVHQEGKTSLAPFYDLLCTAIYPGLVRSFTYSIGGASEYHQLGKKRFAAFETELGIKPGAFTSLLAEMKNSLAKQCNPVASVMMAKHSGAKIAPRIAELIHQRSRAFRWLDNEKEHRFGRN